MKREYWLHPIVAWKPYGNLKRILRISKAAGYSKIVISPLAQITIEDLLGLPENAGGSIEGVWHPKTKAGWFNYDSWMRILNRRTEEQTGYPWDDGFFGARQEVDQKMDIINKRFRRAVFTGHSPINSIGWPRGLYAWEINPDHNMTKPAEILKMPGKFAIDPYHLMRKGRNNSSQIVTSDTLIKFLEQLVDERGQDISVIHLHLAAKKIVPFSLGQVDPLTKEAFNILGSAKNGSVPIVLECFPPVFVNWNWRLSAWYLKRIKAASENLMVKSANR